MISVPEDDFVVLSGPLDKETCLAGPRNRASHPPSLFANNVPVFNRGRRSTTGKTKNEPIITLQYLHGYRLARDTGTGLARSQRLHHL